jgi:hypothetical protein
LRPHLIGKVNLNMLQVFHKRDFRDEWDVWDYGIRIIALLSAGTFCKK